MTLPAGAALGSTSDPAQLIKGDPGAVDTAATRLDDEATRIGRLADDVDAVGVPGWEGGWGRPGYEDRRTAEQAKWRAFADLLEQAGASLTSYAGALRTAQTRAGEAIARWQQGEEATRSAVTAYNDQVAAYNAHQQRCVAVPAYGGAPVAPSMGPARPGPFVDPGEALRAEAEQILADARQSLEEAGATAVRELGGLEGARTESSSGPSASGSVEGPSFNWGAWEDTFGRDPSRGADGQYDNGSSESPWQIDLGEVEGQARVWGAEGSWEDYYGDVRVHADGSVETLGVSGGASAHLGQDGLAARAEGRVTVVGAEGSVGAEYGIAEAELSGEVFGGANAEGEVRAGATGVHASGEVFAGLRAEGSVAGDVGGVGGELGGEAWLGIGASGEADVGYDDGKLTVGGSGGLAFGVGGKVDFEVTLDFGEMAETGEDIIEGVGDFLGL